MSGTAKAILLSPDGMLGRAWVDVLEAKGVVTRTLTYPAFDLTDDARVAAVDWGDADVVINCAAWTDVDGAEARESEATAVNGDGVGRLARACADANTLLLHYSTDYVFSGTAATPYPTDDVLEPVNAYGRSKAEGERQIRAAGGPHLIVRTSWLYAPWGANFVRTMARLGREKEKLRVVDDQRGRPTSAQHLADTSWRLVEGAARGTFHATDGGMCTWFEFARHVVGAVNPDCVVEPCSTAEFPRPAPRPAYSVLDVSSTEAIAGAMPHWTENLDRVLAQL